jgi:hypothetical protein
MNKFFLLTLITLFAAPAVFAQQTFLVKDASKIYDVKIKIESCEDEICNAKGTVYLSKKNQPQAFQTFEMDEMYLTFRAGKTLDGKLLELNKDEFYGLSFADYNFDGILDLLISNGYYKPYGGVSYDVFLFDKAKNKFVKHEGLTELESENVIVEIKKKQKFIETMTKSGCCWHQTARYRINGNRLVKFYVYTEEMSGSDEKEIITTERLVGRRWKKTTKTRRLN